MCVFVCVCVFGYLFVCVHAYMCVKVCVRVCANESGPMYLGLESGKNTALWRWH